MSDLLGRLRREHPDVAVWAAGGVVTRPSDDGVQILVVHRPGHNDWSLPKGKLEKGESLESAAIREVLEETGFSCTREAELPIVRYLDAKNRSKAVVYWVMVVESGSFRSNDEVDTARWVSVEEALTVLDHDRDSELIRGSVRQIGALSERFE